MERSKDVSLGKRTYGCSVAASLKTKYALDSYGVFTPDKLIEGIIYEIEDELKIKREHITKINIINAYRDCVESGKPQLLFYAESDLEAAAIEGAFSNRDSANIRQTFTSSIRSDHDTKQKESRVIQDGHKLVWLAKSALSELTFKENGIGYDGRQGASSGFLEFGKEGLLKVAQRQFLPMLPTHSASVVMLKNYSAK